MNLFKLKYIQDFIKSYKLKIEAKSLNIYKIAKFNDLTIFFVNEEFELQSLNLTERCLIQTIEINPNIL